MPKNKGKAAKKVDQEFDFRRGFGELEEIVSWFERDDLDLDEALVKFERGLELARACQDRLQEVENRVVRIRQRFGT
ncbi:exodeoxyribonuclease VII small subunit [Candidatus Uhrbacteria bacterium]|nr:exodeoxyribonuclease VII small subunit [Candidatus Uhrbacteria bacterium]